MDERTERYRGLFDACYQPLLAYARRRGSAADADDLVAEVLTTAWRRLDDIPTGYELPWLYGVARRTLANQRRGSMRRLRLLERVGSDQAVAPAAEGDDEVAIALAQMSPDDQEILRLAAWEDLRAAEIAVVLGCSANAAALRLSRARRRFRDVMTEIAGARTGASRKEGNG